MATEKTPRRQSIEQELTVRPWFLASSEAVQEQLLGLGEDCNGFLFDLARRPTIGGGVRLVELAQVLIPESRPIFGIFSNFKVERLDNGTIYHYQYFSWKQGPESGARGIGLVKVGNEITHLVCLRGYSFAVGGETYDCPGGFASPTEEGIAGMFQRFKAELGEELGLPDIRFLEVIGLGPMYVDRGLTNNRPELFAAVIDGNEASKIKVGERVNPDVFEIASGPVVIPVAQLAEFVAINHDSYFQNCVLRLIMKDVLAA